MTKLISNDLIKLKIKKYISHYEYVLNTYEETIYLFEEYKKEFYRDCPKNSSKNNTEQNNNDTYNTISEDFIYNRNNINDSNNTNDNNTNDSNESTNNENNKDDTTTHLLKTVNKIYHKLCLKTHPDKDSSNLYGPQFTIISDAYNKKDFLKLLLMCRELHIDIDYVTFENNDYDILFDKSINMLNEKIESIKSTLAWNWVCANDEQKELLRQKFL